MHLLGPLRALFADPAGMKSAVGSTHCISCNVFYASKGQKNPLYSLLLFVFANVCDFLPESIPFRLPARVGKSVLLTKPHAGMLLAQKQSFSHSITDWERRFVCAFLVFLDLHTRIENLKK